MNEVKLTCYLVALCSTVSLFRVTPLRKNLKASLLWLPGSQRSKQLRLVARHRPQLGSETWHFKVIRMAPLSGPKISSFHQRLDTVIACDRYECLSSGCGMQMLTLCWHRKANLWGCAFKGCAPKKRHFLRWSRKRYVDQSGVWLLGRPSHGTSLYTDMGCDYSQDLDLQKVRQKQVCWTGTSLEAWKREANDCLYSAHPFPHLPSLKSRNPFDASKNSWSAITTCQACCHTFLMSWSS